MKTLARNKDIIIKPADKGGKIVLMNKTDYIKEGERQLKNPEHYRRLSTNPTDKFNAEIRKKA